MTSDAGDSIAIGADTDGFVTIDVNGLPDPQAPHVTASSVSHLTVIGGPHANTIDLSGLSLTTFSYQAPDGSSIVVLADGRNGDDTLIGTSDVAATLIGGNGDDSFDLSATELVISFFGFGSLIDAGHGDDSILGGAGHDTVFGGDGYDTIQGGFGNDQLDGGNGQDKIDGEIGDDTITGGMGDDSISGGIGDDWMNGKSGRDTMTGGPGDDSLLGGGGNDVLYGDGDKPETEIGDDTLRGQSGHDTLAGGGGGDTLSGGSGADLLLSYFEPVITIDAAPVQLDPPDPPPNTNTSPTTVDDTAQTIEDNRAVVNVLSNDFDLESNIDIFSIKITTAPSDGTAFVLDNGRILYTPTPGFSGHDTVGYTVSDATENTSNEAMLSVTIVPLDLTGDFMDGGGGNDTIEGNLGPDWITGGGGDDVIRGSNGHDVLLGKGGNDSLCGGYGQDWMDGSTGNDLMESTCGDPFLPTRPEILVVDDIGLEGMTARLLYTIDISTSTRNPFGGTSVGDVNNDGLSDTILDAEIEALIELNNKVIQDGINAVVGIVAYESQSIPA